MKSGTMKRENRSGEEGEGKDAKNILMKAAGCRRCGTFFTL